MEENATVADAKQRVRTTVTLLSKYLAITLLAALLVIGGLVWYQYATDKANLIEDGTYLHGRYWKLYTLPWTDLTVAHPAGWLADEEGTWSGVMYSFVDYQWPPDLPIEEYLDYTHVARSGRLYDDSHGLYDVITAYYSNPAHAAERKAYVEQRDRDRKNGIVGVTVYYLYRDPSGVPTLGSIGNEMPITVTETRTLGNRDWQIGTINGEIDVMVSAFEDVFVVFLTDVGHPERRAVMNIMAEHIDGKGIISEDHPGCCY